MNSLTIKATDSTPYMKFDAETGMFELKGRSLPEDVIEVYEPVVIWFKNYAENPQPVTIFSINLQYFNTASAKIVLQLIYSLEIIIKYGKKVEVHWYYNSKDEECFESGEDYASMVNIPFKFIKFD